MRNNLLVLYLFFNIAFVQNSYSQASISEAQSIFIYNFTRLIEWPSDRSTGNFIIGVYGSLEVFTDLKNYTTGKTVGSQSIEIKKINTPDDISGLHILFVAFGKTKDLPAIYTKIGETSTLIVSEKNGALEQGASINFVIIEDKLKYEFKAANAKKIGLKYNNYLETMSISKH